MLPPAKLGVTGESFWQLGAPNSGPSASQSWRDFALTVQMCKQGAGVLSQVTQPVGGWTQTRTGAWDLYPAFSAPRTPLPGLAPIPAWPRAAAAAAF